MTNTAYMTFLKDALDHSSLTDKEKQGAQAFLAFLNTYQPATGSKTQPDVYEYGDGIDQYALAYFDEETLYNNGVDRAKLPSGKYEPLMRRWAELAWDYISPTDLISDALDKALEDTGLDWNDVNTDD